MECRIDASGNFLPDHDMLAGSNLLWLDRTTATLMF
jgi:hypothetical protein